MLVLSVFSVLMCVSLSLFFLDSVVFYGLVAFFMVGLLALGVGAAVSSWFGLVLALVYVGGLMVMFGFFLAVCPNQQLRGDKKIMVGVLGSGVVLAGLMSFGSDLPSEWGSAKMVVFELFKYVNVGLLGVLVFMLLFALIVVVKVVELKQGPLRPFSGS